jgi:pyruvate carboxylase
MPGAIATMTAQIGQPVKVGDVLLTLEAMKMETSVAAPVDGIVAEILVSVGQTVDAKDLLVVVAPS